MENMESNRMKTYFDKANGLPLAMSIAEVSQLISAKGVTSPPKKSWWNLNNLIIMTTSILLISTAILTFQSTQFNNETKAYAPSLSSISLAQLSDYESEQLNTSYLVKKMTQRDKQIIVATETELEQGEIIGQAIKPLQRMLSNPLNTTGEPATPLEIALPLVQLNEPLKSNLGGDFEGKSKTVTKSFGIEGIETLVISHRNGDVNIETWDQNKIEVSAIFTIKAELPEHELLAINDFDISLNPINKKAIVKSTWDELNNCNCTSSKITSPKKGLRKFLYFSSDGKNNKAKTDSGEAFEYENFKIVYTIKIPKILNVDVSNKYANVSVSQIDGNLDANLFRGNLTANNVGGDVDLTVKYGNAAIGNYQEGTITLFRGELVLGSGNRLDLKSNYSEVELQGATKLNVEAFRSNLIANSSIDKLEGSFKYGDLTIKGHVINAEVDIFRSNLKAVTFVKLNLSASYSSLVADKVIELTLEEGFRTDIKVTEVGSLSGHLKYSPVKIETLTNKIDLTTFRGELDIELIQADFSSVILNSKYTNVGLSFSSESKYGLDVTATYTQFNFPDGISDLRNENEAGSQVSHFVGTFNKGSQRQASTVSVESFQGILKLN